MGCLIKKKGIDVMKTIEELKCKYFEFKIIQKTEEALAAVNQNGDALQFVKDQIEEICLAAVNQNGNVLQYVNIFD